MGRVTSASVWRVTLLGLPVLIRHIGIIDLQGCENARCDTILHVLEMLHDPTHVRAYPASQWHEILSNSGLKIEHLENGLSEKPGGITIQRWCEIARSGPVAEAAIDEFLRICDSCELAQLGIECRADDYSIADWRGSDPPCPNTMATPTIIASRENVAYAAREADHCQSRSATAQ